MLRDHRKRIILIDDHLLLRQGLERLLSTGDEFVVIEEAADAKEGIEMVREMRPDAVIVDIGLPGGQDGLDLTQELLREFPQLVVIVLSAHDEPEFADRALAAGALGYVLKNEAVETLRSTLREAFAGKGAFHTDA
jgi:DNA-binding NarL/FixJ family response regulator